MKLEQPHIDQIRAAFARMQSREDFLQLLNETKTLIYGEKTFPFELKQLTWYANPNLGGKRYREFRIKKKSGSQRSIHAPVKGLKVLQKVLSIILQCVYEPHKAAMGFVRDRSIVDNAKLHVGNNYVYNIDLKDFFPSIDQARVWKTLQLKPFNLNKASSSEPRYVEWEKFKKEYLKVDNVDFYQDKGRMFAFTRIGTIFIAKNFDAQKDKYVLLGSNLLKAKSGKSLKGTLWLVNKIPATNRLEIANMIASLCCTSMEVERKNKAGEWEKVVRNVLPQGAPTSPVVTNIVCQRLDFLLSGVAKRFGMKYSRYADDITFSSMHNVYQPESEFLKELHRIIAEQKFHVKESKTRLQKDGYRKEVTGLLVNEKANVQQRYIKQLRMWLYYWERYGYERASGFFLQQYIADKGHVKNGKPDMANVISGKLDYLKMVKGADDKLYLKLKRRFDKQTGKNSSITETIIESITEPDLNNSMMKLLLSLSNEQLPDIPKIKEETFESISPKKSSIPIIHNPKALVGLLSKFSENSHPLKYACHSWEDGRIEDLFQDYSDFIKKFDEVGKSVCFEIQKLKKPLGTKILHFLNTINEEGKYFIKDQSTDYYWGEYRMRYGWKSKELSNWAKENPAIDPFEFPLPIKSIISKRNRDIEISKFGDVIRIFKNEIEIRPEESALYNLFADLRRKYLGLDFRVVINDNLKGKQFYTDVHDLKRALSKIFREISVRTMHPNVTISANNFPQYGYTIIEILHHESYCIDKSSEEIIQEIYDGDFADIIKYLENLCDWSIESTFNDGSFRINYLSSSVSDLPKESIDSADGFKHIFKFYKT
jgi:hypothetical protein